jgi:hypothetical protein
MMSPSAKSCHITGLLNWALDGGVVGVPAPMGTSCHCWLLPPQSVNWTMLAPSAVDAFWTSSALPLLRLMSRT